MYWKCFFVFKNSCILKPAHVWFLAMAFASIVFLFSLSNTLFLPDCLYGLSMKNEDEQRKGYGIVLTGAIAKADPKKPEDFHESLTISGLQRNITKLSKELRQLKVTVGIYEKLGKIMEKDSSLDKFGSKLHQNVLITSVPYSGDVFLGELFNRYPDVFYLFEPFHSLKYFRENRIPAVYDSMVSSFLQGIFNCDFTAFEYYTEFLSRQYRALIHRLSSRSLSSPPLCPEAITGRYYNIRLCTYLRPPTLSAICKLHIYTFIKTTQITDLETLWQLTNPIGRSENPFRIVELVRDPRAIMFTLLREEQRDNVTEAFFTKESRKICTQQLHNVKYVQESPSWLRRKYIMVKYEDLISDPFHSIEKLSGFLGIAVSARVRSWFTEVLRDGFMWPAVLKADSTLTGTNTGKNLTRSLCEWKNVLTGSQIRLVERECSEVMGLLDYKIHEKHA